MMVQKYGIQLKNCQFNFHSLTQKRNGGNNVHIISHMIIKCIQLKKLSRDERRHACTGVQGTNSVEVLHQEGLNSLCMYENVSQHMHVIDKKNAISTGMFHICKRSYCMQEAKHQCPHGCTQKEQVLLRVNKSEMS